MSASVKSPAFVWGKSPCARAFEPAQCRYSTVLSCPRVARVRRYAENAFSGLSPRQKSASAQPSSRARASCSSISAGVIVHSPSSPGERRKEQ